jgi:hypothetical protein
LIQMRPDRRSTMRPLKTPAAVTLLHIVTSVVKWHRIWQLRRM